MSLNCAIIVAGGSGLRFGGSTPKQFLPLLGKSLLIHSVDKFLTYDKQMLFIVVLPQQFMSLRQEIENYKKAQNIIVVQGGCTRFESVKNGLRAIPVQENTLVAVHDAVRPLVSFETITSCFTRAEKSGAAIPVIPVIDSLRQRINDKTVAVDRRRFVVVQTPQVFALDIIKSAYNQEFNESFTDDASVIESAGHTISIVSGNIENIKITSPMDFLLAEFLLNNNEKI
ncbi:MAG: 2-C-methyl-D-erythritol 4-phosphate cytidylyltransferase [Bacteroidales bacterium]